MLDAVIKWLESHMASCYYKKILGVPCPGCGTQRSIIALLRGDIVESIKQNPATLPLLFLIIIVILHLIFNFKSGYKLIISSLVLVCVSLLLNFSLNIYTHLEDESRKFKHTNGIE